MVLIASRSICFHNRVRFLWLWSCLLWSFVGFRRCRGRSFCLAARAGRCRCGCLMCHCALISCICLSRSALCCRRCLRCVGRYSSGTVTFDLRCLSTVAAIVKKFTTHFFIILIDNQIRGPAAARSRCLCLHFLIRLQGTILGINRRRRINLACLLRRHTDLDTLFQNRNSIQCDRQFSIRCAEACLDSQRIFRVVDELEVRSAVADCRILARCNVGRLVAVCVALRTLKPRKYNRVV